MPPPPPPHTTKRKASPASAANICERCCRSATEHGSATWHKDPTLIAYCISGNATEEEYREYMQNRNPKYGHLAGTQALYEAGKPWVPNYERYSGRCLRYVPSWYKSTQVLPNLASEIDFPTAQSTVLLATTPKAKAKGDRDRPATVQEYGLTGPPGVSQTD